LQSVSELRSLARVCGREFPSSDSKQVRELPKLRGSPRGMTSAIGCTEFSLGTIASLS
jgi:hypothetical protein